MASDEDRIRLAPNEVDLWICRPDDIQDGDELARFDALMTEQERTKQRAFIFEKNRREYLATRALVRTSLSKYRVVRPEDWRFSANAYGRPEPSPPCGLRFNLSNHPKMIVCAICEDVDLGVDVEPIERGPQIVEIATSVFAPRELTELRALPAAEQPDRAVRLWTLKEAYIKARGMGLSLPLDRFAMVFDDRRGPRVTVVPPIVDEPGRWSFRTIDVDGYRISLAVALPSEGLVIRLRN